jgi:hypothetical protein
VPFVVAVFGIKVACASQCCLTASDKIALGSLDIRPNQINLGNTVFVRPCVKPLLT